jgi:hypothetical protein
VERIAHQHETVAPEQRHGLARRQLDRMVEFGEILQIDRCGHHTKKTVVGTVDPLRHEHRRRSDHAVLCGRADEQARIVTRQEVLEIVAI